MTKNASNVTRVALATAVSLSGAYIYNNDELGALGWYSCCGHGDPACTTLHTDEPCIFEENCWAWDECCNNKCYKKPA